MYSAQQNDSRESAALYQAAAALRDAESGNRVQAGAEANAAVKDCFYFTDLLTNNATFYAELAVKPIDV
jgi:hypothetical protein